MVNKQSKAIRLADLIDANLAGAGDAEISAELRRLHKENADFRATCDHLTRENAEQIGEVVALKEQRDGLLEALRNLELGANTVNACYTRNPGNFAAALRDLHEYADAARAAIAKAGGAA